MIDKSFYQDSKIPYRFINKDAIWIELINPVSNSISYPSFKENLFSDLLSLEIKGMHWLENSRLFKETIIATNGQSVNITTVHPLEYAIYKNWLGKRENRNIDKKRRDTQQSRLVTKLIVDYMINIDVEEEVKLLKHFKKEIVDAYMEEIFNG